LKTWSLFRVLILIIWYLFFSPLPYRDATASTKWA
jgi:hypothetical protein